MLRFHPPPALLPACGRKEHVRHGRISKPWESEPRPNQKQLGELFAAIEAIEKNRSQSLQV